MSRPPLSIIEIEQALFMCRSQAGTCWRWLDELSSIGVPKPAYDLVADVTALLVELTEQADEMRASGMLGHHHELLKQMDELKESRAQCLKPYVDVESFMLQAHTPWMTGGIKSGCTGRDERMYISKQISSPAAQQYDVKFVAAELFSTYCCVIDGFMREPAAASLRALVLSMRAQGEMHPGEVSSGLKQETRGDLMKWVSCEAGEQPAALYKLLSAIDRLVGALSCEMLLHEDLGDGKLLVRHEMQVTCYPANGAKYVRHVDDALKHRGRRLTCIYYANEGWTQADGGVLRIHTGRAPRDIEPLDRRLVLFWSDSRCPHEVLPTYKERFAVSVWISDAAALAEAATREAAGDCGLTAKA
mmetsp:Transcript_52136/g.86466  ORF Transcript_52136/g.86466 Transcript_52136/m.86466 type:complete len:360 (+) Transcript_52136:108-1187(+)|eukprot:CAMPEP_0119318746 /NCGR_PEP_ID=MMETSP1333-20130426/47528_1 /TAXON_ID=418940 /ORGANISM="Scyphosphaera apsteinii, Strain RCC1455" /LENGTH=359 /DNA_ID=CAMNT_0007325011 /DNA_START=100 /DNA_END=1179 /DNA_ORIENTATION=+